MLEAFKSLHYFIFFSDTEHFLSYKLCFRHGLTKPSRPRSSKIRQVQEYDASCQFTTDESFSPHPRRIDASQRETDSAKSKDANERLVDDEQSMILLVSVVPLKG